MSRRIVASVVMVASAVTAHAQVWAPILRVSQTIGNEQRRVCIGGANDFVGCPSNSLYLSTGGLVGIGTANPNAQLDVYGTVSATNFVGDGSGLTGLAASGDRIVSGTTNITAHLNSSLTFTTNSQQRMVISEDGRVGIGGGATTMLTVAGPTGLHFNSTAGSPEGGSISWNGDGTGWMLNFQPRHSVTGALVGSPVMSLIDAGRVGIGSISPLAKLDVAGTISASDAIQVGASSLTCGAGIPGAIRYQGTSLEYCNGTVWTALGAAGATTAASSTGAVQFNVNNALAGDTDNFFWDNANKRLGLGTNTPAYALQVSTTTGSYGFSHSDGIANLASFIGANANWGTTTNHGLGLFTNGVNAMLITPEQRIGIGTVTPAATLQVSGTFTVSTSAQGTTSASIFVGPSGLVGVGTRTPLVNLHIAGNGVPMRIDSTNGNAFKLGWASNGVVNGYIGAAAGAPLVVGSSGGHIRMYMLENGNIGVSTTTPRAKLDVAGTISASDAIQVGTSGLTCGPGIAGAIRYETTSNTLQICTGATGWRSLVSGTAGAGATSLAALTDVNITSLAGRDYLRYDFATSRWVNISESTVMSTTTMVPNWPDALNCSSAAGSASIVNLTTSVAGALRVYGFNAGGSSVGYQIHFNNDGSWNTIINSPGWADVAGCTGKTIAQLYAEGRAFNFIGNSGVSGGALGDRITSGTHAVTVNTASGIISLTTGGTSWGYLASGNSYLPLLTSGRVSSTNISGTLIQAGASTAACNAGLAGGIRYSAVSNTLQVCTGATGWKSLTSGTAVSSLDALADVNITNLAGRDYLRYDSVTSRWVNISESMVMSTTTMINAWPDAIMCTNSADTSAVLLMVHSLKASDNSHYYYYPGSTSYFARFNGDGSYNAGGYQTTAGPHPCQNRTIGQLYASGQAFNFIGNAATGGALGDRLTSGTHAVTVNEASGLVSLSTAGTTWGYLNSARSYLPALSSGQVSSTNVSATLLQIGTGNGAACDVTMRGSMRYSTTSNTIEYCNSSAWVGVGPSTSVPAFVVTKSSNQTVSIGTWTKVTWNNEVADSNNNFDMGNSRFMPTVPGYYHLNGSLQCNTSGTSCSAGIYKNGALVYMSMMVGNTPITNVSGMVYLNGAGDYVELYGYDSGGTTFRGYAAYTYFSGALMGGGGGTGSGGGGGSSDLAGLTDVTLTNLAGRDYLRYDAGTTRWVNVSESTVMSTTTMVSGWPDAIMCNDGGAKQVLALQYSDATATLYAPPYDGSAGRTYVLFNSTTKAYQSQVGLTGYDCVSNALSISQLYAAGQAFNFIGNSGANGDNALGDRITSGTHVVTVNTSSGYVSLSTAGTTWGYFGSGTSYLPGLLTVGGGVSVTGNVSVTGSVQAFSYLHPSDARLKSDIATIPNAVEMLEALRGTRFTWTSNGRFSYGLIAQEIEKVMPSAVQGTDSKVVDYNQFIAVLVEGWKAHHNAIKSLKASNDSLEQRVQNFELTNDGLRRWNLQLRKELEAVKADNDNLRAEFTALRGEVQQLRQANAP